MAYSVELLTTVADCDALIGIADKERGDLDFKRTGLVRKQSVSSTNAVSIQTEIASVTAAISNLNSQLLVITDPVTHASLEDQLYRATFKLYTLNARKAATGTRAVSQQDYDIISIDANIAQNEAYLVALNARKAELAV